MHRLGYAHEHEQFRQTARTFLDREHERHQKRFEREGGVDAEFWRNAGKAGLLGSGVPEAYGGAGGDVTFNVVLAEEVGRTVGGATTGASLMSDIATHVLNQHGTDEQKRRYFPGILSGEVIQSLALTEPGAGSDVTAIKATARREGDEFVLNGEKYFITNGSKANLLFVVVKTDPTKRGAGMSVILVDGHPPGLTRSKLKLIAWGAGDTAALSFDNVRVPAANLLGGEGAGMNVLMSTFLEDRLQIAARCVGAASAALALTLDYVRQRPAFGQHVFDFQNTQFALADVKTDVIAGQAFLDTCLVKFRDGKLSFDEGAMLKLWTTEMEGRVMDKCLQLFGAAGMMDETPIARMFTAARAQRIYAGTSELQKVAIAKAL